jgi:hypothetical protein
MLPNLAHAGVDWASGLVTADGLGIADRHAPSPATARGTSRRVAEDAARVELSRAILALPLAGGGTVGKHAGNDPAVKTRLDAAIAHAYSVAAEPETDGAWRVTMAVPIEAVRQALDGPREVAATGDNGPSVIVVDGAAAAKPAIDYAVGGVHGAAIFVTDVPAWASTAPHVIASKISAGAIDAPATGATPATLFVIVAK